MKPTKRKPRISYNAPVVLTFVLACLAVTIAGMLTNGESTAAWFCVRIRSLADPMMYVGFLSHVFGHIDLGHFLNNAMLLLLVGPMLEEKYGSRAIAELIIAVAFFTGVAHCVVSPGSALCGASGIAFAFVVLASFASVKERAIPLSVILVMGLFLGNEIYSGIMVDDAVSNLSHIIGGLVGAVAGIALNSKHFLVRFKR